MAVLTNGTVIEREDPPTSWTPVGSVTDFTPPARQRAAVDTSHLGSPVKTAKAGMIDNGEFTFEVLFDKSDTAQSEVEGDLDSGAQINYRLTLNDGPTPTKRTMPCIVTHFAVTGGGIDSPIKANVTLKVVGAITAS
jgi:hypothetical protein